MEKYLSTSSSEDEEEDNGAFSARHNVSSPMYCQQPSQPSQSQPSQDSDGIRLPQLPPFESHPSQEEEEVPTQLDIASLQGPVVFTEEEV